MGVSDPSLPVDPNRRVTLVLDEFHALGRIDRLECPGSRPRKGARGGRSPAEPQPAAARLRLGSWAGGTRPVPDPDLLGPGGRSSSDQAEALMKRRTLVWRERNTDPDKKGLYKTERGELPLVSATTLERDLGVRQVGPDSKNPNHKVVRAVIAGLGDVYQFDWPLTVWAEAARRLRPGTLADCGRRRQAAPARPTRAARRSRLKLFVGLASRDVHSYDHDQVTANSTEMI